MKKIGLFFFFAIAFSMLSCSKNSHGTSMAVKPRYHRTWYKDHVYKKKWHIGRIKLMPEKQGVKKVRMKN